HHAEVLHPNPAERAAQFEEQGFPWLHVVDLNGAFEGRSVNTSEVEAILKKVKIPVQLSGGIRDMKTIEHWIHKNVERVVLTAAAVQNPELVKEACKKFPGRIGVKI